MKMPTHTKLIKIMCSHPEPPTKPGTSAAIRFEEAAKEAKVLYTGWLNGYCLVQIDHSAN